MTWRHRRVVQRLRVLAALSQSGGSMSRPSPAPAGLASPTALPRSTPRNPDAISQAVDELFESYGWGPGIPRRLG